MVINNMNSAGVSIESMIPFRIRFYNRQGEDTTVINNGSLPVGTDRNKNSTKDKK